MALRCSPGSLKQQGVDHLFGVVGFPITAIAAAAQQEGIAYLGMRNEQSAAYAAGAYGYLTAGLAPASPSPAGVVHGLAGPANAQQNCWPMILIGGASRPIARRHGCLPGGTAGADRLAVLQVRARHRDRLAFPTMSRWRPGTRSTAGPAPATLDMPDDIIRGTCELDKASQVERVPEPPRMVAPAENIEAALNLLEKAQRPLLVPGRQGHGVGACRGRGPRLHRAHTGAVRALADGQGRAA